MEIEQRDAIHFVIDECMKALDILMGLDKHDGSREKGL
jgi:hypothetical protein